MRFFLFCLLMLNVKLIPIFHLINTLLIIFKELTVVDMILESLQLPLEKKMNFKVTTLIN